MSNVQARFHVKVEQKNRNHNNKFPFSREYKTVDKDDKYVFWDKRKAQKMLLWKLLDWGYYKNHWQIMDDLLEYEKNRMGVKSSFMFYIRSMFEKQNGKTREE